MGFLDLEHLSERKSAGHADECLCKRLMGLRIGDCWVHIRSSESVFIFASSCVSGDGSREARPEFWLFKRLTHGENEVKLC